MNWRQLFETAATAKFGWSLRRSDHGYYMDSHVEYAWIGYCMANNLDHEAIP